MEAVMTAITIIGLSLLAVGVAVTLVARERRRRRRAVILARIRRLSLLDKAQAGRQTWCR
jgi:hypothetical protein